MCLMIKDVCAEVLYLLCGFLSNLHVHCGQITVACFRNVKGSGTFVPNIKHVQSTVFKISVKTALSALFGL